MRISSSSPLRLRHRARIGGLVAAAALCATMLVGTLPAGAFELSPGWNIEGATITGPAPSQPRTLNGDQAAAFLQTFLFASMFGKLPFENPPKDLPVYRVEAKGTYDGAPSHVVAKYATDGKTAWVALPPQNIAPGAFVDKERWVHGTEKTRLGFEGKLDPVPGVAQDAPPETAAPDTTAPNDAQAAPASHGSDDSTSWGVIVGVGVAVLVVAGAVVVVLRRRRTPAGA